MEIIPGVHIIEAFGIGRPGSGQVYLYQEADRLTLIDTGLVGNGHHIIEAIAGLGRWPADLAQIFITHYHNDHIGSLAEVVERTHAQVLAHPLDADVVRGERVAPWPELEGWEKELAAQVAAELEPWPPSRVDREVVDGDTIDLDGGATVVHVPGHTPGSIALYVPRRKLLFCGDAVASFEGRAIVGLFNLDRDAAQASFRRLAELDFEVACFGHGAPLDREASLAFRRTAEKLGGG
jgi:glyoxylase-like metal-dependent hydrolase (beta-lactamase superfamily II)